MLAADVVGLAPWAAALAVSIVLLGSALQASIGVGLGLLAAPTLSLIDPDFIPGALTVCVVPLTVGMTLRERHHIDRSILRAVAGRFVGVVVGAWLVASTGQRSVAIVVGLSVLFAVIASATGLRFAPTRRRTTFTTEMITVGKMRKALMAPCTPANRRCRCLSACLRRLPICPLDRAAHSHGPRPFRCNAAHLSPLATSSAAYR